MDLFVRPELQYVRASKKPTNRTETYEFAIRVKLDNEKKKDDELDEAQGEAG